MLQMIVVYVVVTVPGVAHMVFVVTGHMFVMMTVMEMKIVILV